MSRKPDHDCLLAPFSDFDIFLVVLVVDFQNLDFHNIIKLFLLLSKLMNENVIEFESVRFQTAQMTDIDVHCFKFN